MRPRRSWFPVVNVLQRLPSDSERFELDTRCGLNLGASLDTALEALRRLPGLNAAIVMDTHDISFDSSESKRRDPSLPLTSVAEVVSRDYEQARRDDARDRA